MMCGSSPWRAPPWQPAGILPPADLPAASYTRTDARNSEPGVTVIVACGHRGRVLPCVPMLVRLLVVVLGILAGGAVGAAPEEPSASPTFSHDIARLLQQHCQECHRPGGAAPFALIKYEHVYAKRDKILESVEKRRMPPWKAVPGYGDFAGVRRLSQADITAVARWVAAGAPEGDPRHLTPPREFA